MQSSQQNNTSSAPRGTVTQPTPQPPITIDTTTLAALPVDERRTAITALVTGLIGMWDTGEARHDAGRVAHATRSALANLHRKYGVASQEVIR